ncbi:MAG: HEAT repeat domain-containing protein [Myxococcus sp.]|nr:HEAT repeat domain-containing protein [Myxococcus sp.]
MAHHTIGHLEQVKALAATGRTLAIGGTRLSGASAVTLFDAGTRKVLRQLPLATNALALAFSGPKLVVGGADGKLHRFDFATGEGQGSVEAHAGGVTALASSGALVASTGVDGRVVVWADGAKQHEFQARGVQRAVALDALSGRVAAAGDDGVVRVFTFATKAVREMEGHRGAVTALAFTPRDGRLASTGDDGATRLWYLEGAVECEVRGEGDTGHAGGATAFTFLPVPKADAKDASDRLMSTGHDAKVRTTRLDDKKRSKTFEADGVQRAIAVVESDPRKALCEVVVGGDRRTLTFITVAVDGQLVEATDVGLDFFAVTAAQLKSAQRAAKEALARDLPRVAEGEVVPLLQTLAGDKDAPVRLALAKALGAGPRKDARRLLRGLVRDSDAAVALAALEALSKTEDQPFAAWREGVRASAPSVRVAALKALAPLYPAVPLVPALLAGALRDADPNVRLAGLDALQAVFPEGVEALALGFEKGSPDVRAEVLVRALLTSKLPQLQSISGRALDDDAVLVRQVAFVVRVLERPAVAALLEKMLELPEVYRRANGGKDPNAEQLAALRTKLGLANASKELTQDDLTPLLVAMSARATDVASRGAAGLLFAAGDVRAVSALLQLSREEPAAHRVWVVQTLAQLSDPRARQRLASMVDDAEAPVRAAAADALTKRKDEAHPLEFTGVLLRSAFEDMRKRGLSRLVGLAAAARTEEAETLLGHALEDEAAAVRAEAFKTLWAWHDKDAAGAIDRALQARFADLRLAAVRQLSLIAKVPSDDDQPAPKGTPAWVLERLEKAVLDRDAAVGEAALVALARLLGRGAASPWLKGLEAEAAATRVLAARRAAVLSGKPEAEALRSPLVKALADLSIPVRLAALESADALVKDDTGPLTAGLLSDALEVRVRAAELLAKRGDEVIVEPMRGFVLDAELKLRHPPAFLEPLRARATGALATLGSARTAALFADPLLKDENPAVREQAARGLCNAGAEGLLLDALSHADVAVRSWAAEGLARLGDDRGLAVLTGTLKDSHLPIREGALRALVALGSAGDNALFLGLDDADDYLSDTFFATLLARDLRAAREGHEPELLTAALSARRADVRYAAARALELRADVGAYTELLLEAVSPAKPEKAGDMKDWPEEGERERAAMRLVQLLSADTPQARYLAGQTLLLRRKPLEFFAEVKRVVALRPAAETVVPDTNQRGRASTDAVARKDWLRKLFAGAATKVASPNEKELEVRRWIAFGAYVGLLRLSSPDETVRRVRRDCVDRMTELASAGSPKPASVVPALVRALDDEDGLVRKKAMAGLTKLLAATPDVAVRHALSSSSADVGLLALEQLNARGPTARPWFVEALASNVPEVRQHAFVLLERADGPGSLDALMAALGSPHADLRLGVLQKLAASRDARVVPALRKALESDREDVRLLAAQLLAERRDDSAVPVLASFLVVDGPLLDAARVALSTCATDAAALALVNHLQELAAMPTASEPTKSAPAAKPAGPRLDADLEAMLRANRKGEAIALYRSRSGLGLKEAKDAIDAWSEPAAAATDSAGVPSTSGLKRDAIGALAGTRRPIALEPLLAFFDDPAADVRLAALSGALLLTNHRRPPVKGAPSKAHLADEKRAPRNGPGVLQTIRAAVRAKDAALRCAGAREADVGAEPEYGPLLASLFADRDVATRVQAVTSYAARVEKHDAPQAPLEQVLAQGNRELMLAAAEGLAMKQHPASLRPLLLFVRAGEVEEQARAVLALGASGQLRALEELELLAAGGTEEAPTPPLVRGAAIEALGRLFKALTEAEVRKRVIEFIEAASLEGEFRLAGVRSLRWVGDDRALGKLQLIAGDAGDFDFEVRKEATRALGALADPSSEAVLARGLKVHQLAETSLQALEACFPSDPLRVALSAASSELPAISGPALAYLLAEAEPGPLLERLANPRLQPALRAKVKFGLGRRATLPTDALVKFTASDFPSVREDMAWLMARHALAGAALPPGEQSQRAQALVAAATSTATRWARSVGTDKVAEESAFLRLLWAATLHEARQVQELAAKSLAGASPAPASVRAEAARVLVHAGVGAAPVLAKASGDVDGGVRRAAVSALIASSVPQAVALLESSKPLDSLAFDALRADALMLATEAGRAVMLPKLIGARVPTALMTQAESGSSEAVQRAALMALGRMGGEDVTAFLAKLAFSAGGGDGDDDEDDGGDDEEELDDDDGDDGDSDDDEDDGPSPDVSMPGARRFEFEEDDSSKFWEVMVVDTTTTVRFGKIGSAGQKKPKKLATPEAAQKEMEKLIKEKTGKGYSEVKPRGVKPPKAVEAPKPPEPKAAPPPPKLEAPWGTPALREAAFRALRRAQRTTLRRQNAPKWFTAEQLAQLASDPALAEAMMPAAPQKPARRGGDDDDDDGDDDSYADDDGDDEDYDDDE